MEAKYLQSKHEGGASYNDYVRSGTDQQFENWKQVYDQCAPGSAGALTNDQTKLITGFTRRINIIAVSGIWCGDCVQQGPLVARIAEANPDSIDMRWLDRDEHIDLQERVRINAGNRVPVLIFCAEDYEFVSWYGDRTLSRYRAIAAKQLGAACPMPGAPIDQSEMADTTAEWVEQFERVHLLLRLSGRLRQIHGD